MKEGDKRIGDDFMLKVKEIIIPAFYPDGSPVDIKEGVKLDGTIISRIFDDYFLISFFSL